MEFSNIFVTVGTTSFPLLIETINSPEMLETLKEVKCREINVQTGSSSTDFTEELRHFGFKYFTYTDKMQKYYDKADLVISHAGAGTCMEVLSTGKPLIVVVNETLMHNHQWELAEQLASENVLACCTTATLCRTISHFNPAKLKKYKKGDPGNFVKELDKYMGFV